MYANVTLGCVKEEKPGGVDELNNAINHINLLNDKLARLTSYIKNGNIPMSEEDTVSEPNRPLLVILRDAPSEINRIVDACVDQVEEIRELLR